MENGETGITSTKDLCRVTSMIRQFTEYIGGFIAKTKRYTDIMELTPNLPRLFIRKIMVQEKSTKWSKEAMRAIKIHSNGIGCVGVEVPQGKESPRRETST